MADEQEIANQLEAERNMAILPEPQQSEPRSMGIGSYVLILFALFVDIIEIVTTYTGVGVIIAIPLGLAVDAFIFAKVGLSKNTRKQWKRFGLGFIMENFPILASALEFIPFRTLSLIWMYRGISMQNKEQSEKTDEQ